MAGMKRRFPKLIATLVLIAIVTVVAVTLMGGVLGLHKRLTYYGSDGTHEIFVFAASKSLPDFSKRNPIPKQEISIRFKGSWLKQGAVTIPENAMYSVTSFNGRSYFGPRNFDRTSTDWAYQLSDGGISQAVDLSSLYKALVTECAARAIAEKDISYFVYDGAFWDNGRGEVSVAVSAVLKGAQQAKRGPAYYCYVDQGFKLIEKPWGELCVRSGRYLFYVHPVTGWIKRVTVPASKPKEPEEEIYARSDNSEVKDLKVSGLFNGKVVAYNAFTESATLVDFSKPDNLQTVMRGELLRHGARSKTGP
jgi:hypothetical protein